MRSMDREDILAVMDKYKAYFDTRNAGVAEAVRGEDVFFYVMEDENGPDHFATFHSAAQLEELILETVAEDLAGLLEAITADRPDVAPEIGELLLARPAVADIPRLARALSSVRDEGKEWADLIDRALRPLREARPELLEG